MLILVNYYRRDHEQIRDSDNRLLSLLTLSSLLSSLREKNHACAVCPRSQNSIHRATRRKMWKMRSSRQKERGRRILLDVGGNWCKWCHYLDRFWRSKQRRRRFPSREIYLCENQLQQGKREQRLSLKIPKDSRLPAFLVLNSDGTLLWSQDTGELESGQGHDHDKLLAVPQKVGALMDSPFKTKRPPSSGGLLISLLPRLSLY